MQVVEPVDQRIHFALVCGAKSCPPIKVYTPQSLEEGLDSTTAAFCEGVHFQPCIIVTVPASGQKFQEKASNDILLHVHTQSRIVQVLTADMQPLTQ